MAMVFPLITQQMFAGMTYKWALTLWALVSAVMAPTPWVGNLHLFRDLRYYNAIQVLFFFGSKIRSRSKVSRKILEAEIQQLDGEKTVASSPIEEKTIQV